MKLIDNFSINTAYNIFADSIKWSPLSMQLRTTLMENIGLSANSSFSLYGTDSQGRSIGTLNFTQNGKLMRLTNFNASVDFSLSELFTKNEERRNKAAVQSANDRRTQVTGDDNLGLPATDGHEHVGASPRDAWGYSIFDVPWTMNVAYTFAYYDSGTKPVYTQAVSIDGNLTLTKKTSINYRSGYDFTGKEITMSSIGVSRDLHCWEMNVMWYPNGSMQSWSFTIRVKASVLGDLKYDRRKDYHDSY